MRSFNDFYDNRKIRADERTVLKIEQKLHISEDPKKRSIAFENMLVRCIQDRHFFDDLYTTVEYTNRGAKFKEHVNFNIDTRHTAKYDDYCRGTDFFSTIGVSDKFREDFPGFSEVIIGFDATYNSNPHKIETKLRKSYSDHINLPFGFSALEYYKKPGEHGNARLVPHYVLGLNYYDIDEFLDEEKNYGHISKKTEYITKFKLLSEIQAESMLFISMLPDDMDDTEAENAGTILCGFKKIITEARNNCADKIIRNKFVPPNVLKQIEECPKRKSEIIETELIIEGAAKYEEEFKKDTAKYYRRLLRDPNFRDPPPEYTGDIFGSVITITSDLKDKAYKGELEDERRIMDHSRVVVKENKDGLTGSVNKK